MPKFIAFLMLLLASSGARAATIELCGTHDAFDKYFVGEVGSRANVQKKAVALCVARRGARAACRKNITCTTVKNSRVARIKKIIPFPPEMRGPQPRPARPSPGRPSRPSAPSTPVTPPHDTSPGGSCRVNNDCYSYQYCAGGQCFERKGGGSGGQSCRSNNDCYSNDFCVSGQCFPKTGPGGHSCQQNNDCYSYQFCVSGQCFDK